MISPGFLSTLLTTIFQSSFFTPPSLLNFSLIVGEPQGSAHVPFLSTLSSTMISSHLVSLNIIYMRMTAKFISPGRSSLLTSRLVYPIVFVIPPLIIWLMDSSHLIHPKLKPWFPPLLKPYSSLPTSSLVLILVSLHQQMVPPFTQLFKPKS